MEFDNLKDLLAKNRSYRRFDQSHKISPESLVKIIELATLCASGRNLQPIKYKIVSTEDDCEKIFHTLAWAGYLTDWNGPQEGERPSAYLVQCLDKNLTDNPMCDEGLQLEAITLGAVAFGLGTCIIKSFNPKKIIDILNLPENICPTHIVALGYPAEQVVIEPMKDGDIKYWRDKNSVHHVPKRGIKEILVK